MPDAPAIPVFRQDIDLMAWGAYPIVGTISKAPSVFVNGIPIMTVLSLTANAGVMVTGSASVFAEGLPVCRIGDLAESEGGVQEVLEGSPNVFSV